MPFNSDSSFWTYLDSDPLESAPDARRYIARMRDIPRYFDEQIVNMRAGLARGFTVPQVTLAGRDASIATFAGRDMSETHFTSRSTTCRRRCRAPSNSCFATRATRRSAQVIPAYGSCSSFYREEYSAQGADHVSARDLPDGDAFYRAQIREYTTTDLTPEEIHQLGLKQVARIEAEMRQDHGRSGLQGIVRGFPQIPEDRPAILRKDARRADGRLGLCAKRTDGKIGNYLRELPRRRFGIMPVPDALAPFYTSGARRARGLHDEHLRSADAAALQYPGSDASRMRARPQLSGGSVGRAEGAAAFRQNLYFSGYRRGLGPLQRVARYTRWASIATPYERFGRRATRCGAPPGLVIDTGIHRYGWSRQQAIDYLASHTALSQHEVETESRPLHQLAGPGAVVQDRRADDPPPPLRSRDKARAQVRRARASTTRSWIWAVFRSMFLRRIT